MATRLMAFLAIAAMPAMLAACGQTEGGIISAGAKPLSKQAMHLLGSKGMQPQAPIFVRIFKEESELEVWKARDDGRFYHFKTYPICTWSGELGPKQVEGDKQSPEGYYWVANNQLNPNSQFYLAFNLGFPNAYDKALGRTGSALMVHGNCKSVGCYAMTDALVEEIYGLAREALSGGQQQFAVHAFPFRMTEQNMERHKQSPWTGFWKTMKEGYDSFELSREVPPVAICNKSYIVNAAFNDENSAVDPAGPCPAFSRRKPELFVEALQPGAPTQVAKRIMAPGKKTRNLAAETALAQSGPAPAVADWTISNALGFSGN